MSNINQLSTVETLSGGDLLPVWDTSNGDTRKSSVTVLADYMQDNLDFGVANNFTTQYSSPLTGATVAITDGADDNTNVHIIITPLATIAALTLTLPLATSCVDGQEILITSTQHVTALTLSLNGASAVRGLPLELVKYGNVVLKYDAPNLLWYNVSKPNEVQGNFTRQAVTPTTGQTVTVTSNGHNVRLIIIPLGTLANLAIALPSTTDAVDQQTVTITTAQELTSLTFSSSGSNDIVGDPSTLAANTFCTLMYDEYLTNWYRVA